MTDPFAAIGDPTRRRVLELLATGEHAAGELLAAIQGERTISQGAMSQHLAALRNAGLVNVRVDGQRRLYTTRVEMLQTIAAWVDHVLPGFDQPLDALGTEIARGKIERRSSPGAVATTSRSQAS